MDKVLISVDEMADILKDAFENDLEVVTNEFCKICLEMHDGHCPTPEVLYCPHERIVEYRYFVRSHFRRYIFRE